MYSGVPEVGMGWPKTACPCFWMAATSGALPGSGCSGPASSRRLIPEEDSAAVEAEVRALIAGAVAPCPGIRLEIKRLLLAMALQPQTANQPLVDALQRHGQVVFGEPIPTSGTPLYTDVRLYGEHGVPAVIYGAGPRTVLESNAKRADEHLVLSDLRGATKVIARTLFDLLST